MPSIAQAILEPINGKKRSRQEAELSDESGQTIRCSRSNLDLPTCTDEARFFEAHSRKDDSIEAWSHIEPRKRIIPRPMLQTHDFASPGTKRQRVDSSLTWGGSTISKTPPSLRLHNLTSSSHPPAVSTKEVTKTRKTDLSPCYICHRKPTTKNELDSYADCEECGKRTCWICTRECLGVGVLSSGLMTPMLEETIEFSRDTSLDPHMKIRRETEDIHIMGNDGYSERQRLVEAKALSSHRSRICSRCCIERGSDGEVWCLGCLRIEADG